MRSGAGDASTSAGLVAAVARAVKIALGAYALVPILGCSPIPAALRVEPLAATQPGEAAASDMRGGMVRWGGQITKVDHEPKETCFDVTSRPLDLWARPAPTDQTLGRFRACAPGFYEPADYAPGRDTTVVGTLSGNVTEKIGEQTIEVPLVNAQAVHLWPQRPQYVYVPYPAWGFGPYPYWGWGWGGGWGPWGCGPGWCGL